MYLLCICPSLHNYIRFRFHKTKLQWSEQQKPFLTCLWHSATVQIPIQIKIKIKTWTQIHSKSFLLRFKFSQNSFQFLYSPGRLQWLVTCSTQIQSQLQSPKPRMLPDASENSKPTFPNRQTQSTLSFLSSQYVVNQQPQHQVLPCLTWRFLSLYLYQHSSA